MVHSLADIRAALLDTLPPRVEDDQGRVAAVAAILRAGPDDAELLFIRRATRRGDPWSGHMAWPGGKREPNDDGLLGCAIRETREEVGLDLRETGKLIGTLRAFRRQSAAATTGLRAVYPFVFVLNAEPGQASGLGLSPGGEVQEAVWIPLSYFTQWSTRRPWRWIARSLPATPPAYRYQGRIIWGLTQWMLADLLQRLARHRAGEKGSGIR